MASDARSNILSALRTRKWQQELEAHAEPPEISGDWLSTPDPGARIALFIRMLEAAGGHCQQVANSEDLDAKLAETPEFAAAERRVSLLPGTRGWLPGTGKSRTPGRANVDLSAISRPQDLADVDFALLPGVFGVAENGAVWIDGEALPQRSVLVLPEHLGIVVSASELVDHMHAAYERLSFDGPGFGCFVSGPSKTADIEQALVIGAHGARSLTVFLLED